MLANTYKPRPGVAPLRFKGAPAVMKRIEWLGQMNDRVKICLAANDGPGLRQLAARYAERNMPRTAHMVALMAGTVAR